MRFGLFARRDRLAAPVWAAMLLSIAVLVIVPLDQAGWDLDIYKTAVVSLQRGHDPYMDAMAVQRAFHATLASHPNATPPYSYVYSPITLPLLRWVGRFTFAWSTAVYWVGYIASVWVMVRVGLWMSERAERVWFAVFAPVSLFFPGLLHHDTVLSGNVAFLCYGAALGAAWMGWRRGVWWPFYVAVVAASCLKAPLLSLLAIPVFSARRQGWAAGASAAAGVALFAVQPHIWPVAFRNYLEAVDLQFRFNRDFSSSPAGVLANLFYNVTSYKVVSLVGYLLYAIPVVWALWWFSRRLVQGDLTIKQWAPVLLVGVIVLNPRIMEYDAAPIALPMALILWRWCAEGRSSGRAAVVFGALFVLANALAVVAWKPTECVLLLSCFTLGCWRLGRRIEAPGSIAFRTEPSMATAGSGD